MIYVSVILVGVSQPKGPQKASIERQGCSMSTSKFRAGALSALVIFGITITPSQAQESRSTLSGTITDSSGSAIVHAQVRIINTETALTQTAVSNEVGVYRLLFVNPGTYRLTVEMPGFRTFIRENLLLTLGEAATLDVPMEVGSQTETVTVAAQ